MESHLTHTIIAIALDPIAMAHAVGGSSAMQGYFSSCMDAVPALLDAICEVTDEATARRTHAQRVRSPPVQKHSVPATTSLRPTTCPEQRL